MSNHALSIAKIMLKDKIVTPALIEETLDKIALILGIPFDKEELRRLLMYELDITVGEPRILVDPTSELPWLNAKKEDITWNFWSRYHEYIHNSMAPTSLNKLDELTDKVLDLLFDPTSEGLADKRGLVVGNVQSGKTSNYIGLINKAIDAGFKIIIVLAGIHNSLRSQTQSRIDDGVLGYDTQRLMRVDPQTTFIGVAKGLSKEYREKAIAHSLTSSNEDGDFKDSNVRALGINPDTNEAIVFIVKKNKSVLDRLRIWLKGITIASNDGKYVANKPLLLIDDEADHASINTSADPERSTAINNAIRKILTLFNKKAYVGYTATPFANIFIPIDTDDLFPKDFIINIPSPSNYMGPKQIFDFNPDASEDDDREIDVSLPIVSLINDYSDAFPDKHKKNDSLPNALPDSLKFAIKCFIINCAIRIIRKQEKEHNSMLIHVSRYIPWQTQIAILVRNEFQGLKLGIRYGDVDVLSSIEDAYKNGFGDLIGYQEISKELRERNFFNDGYIAAHLWDTVKKHLLKASEKIVIKELNGSSKDILDYYENEKNGLSAIIIGADKLSRGMTLEGLSVSYFLRASKMYDTLMQMGRWFGYRRGYADICRLFMSEELYRWFSFITIASDELRDDFDKMANDKKSKPIDYALKVRSHPGVLQISASNKIRTAIDMQITHAGSLAQSTIFSIAKYDIAHNYVVLGELVNSMQNIIIKCLKKGIVWYDVPSSAITGFFASYRGHKENHAYSPATITKYIVAQNRENNLTNWRVALISKGRSEKSSIFNINNTDHKIGWIQRTNASSHDGMFSIKKAQLLNPWDECIDLEKEEIERAQYLTDKHHRDLNTKRTYNYPNGKVIRAKIRNTNSPLMIIYLIDHPQNTRLDIGEDIPFVGYVISFPADKNYRPVSYMIPSQLISNFDNDDDFEEYED